MLESAVVSALVALPVSLLAGFMFHWGAAMHVRRIRFDLDDVIDKLMRDDKRRAAAVSVSRRSGNAQGEPLNALDAALLAKHVGTATTAPADPPAWFDTLVAKKRAGPASDT